MPLGEKVQKSRTCEMSFFDVSALYEMLKSHYCGLIGVAQAEIC